MAQNPRPKIRIPYSPTEIAIEIASLAALAYVIIVFLSYWQKLPAIVPTHFGFSGQPDASGPKQTLFIMPVTTAMLYIVLTVVRQFPWASNTIVPITEDNAERQYRLVTSLLSWLKVETMWLLAYLTSMTLKVAMGRAGGLGVWPLPVVVAAMFVTLGIYMVLSVRAK